MKRQFISWALGTALVLLVVNYALAQDIKSLPPVTVSVAATSAMISSKLSRSFHSDFKNAVSPTWYKLSKNYLVSFMADDMRHKALYQKNGNLIYNISYGYEKDLPNAIRHDVKSVYYDYTISSIIHVKQYGRNIWLVNLQDNKKLIIVRAEDGMVDEVSNYTKRQ
jgi:hypothetical protein